MSQAKTFAKLLGVESLYMILITLIACITSLIQAIYTKHIGDSASYKFTTSNYQYSYVMYFLGFVLYICAAYLLYKVFEKSLAHFPEINIVLKLLTFVALIFWGYVMCIMEGVVLFFTVLGLSRNLRPEGFFGFTVIGWPTITVLFIGIEYIRMSKKIK